MPDITDKENELLKMLTSTNVLTLGKGRMKEVAAFCHRLMYLADQAAQRERAAQLMSNGFWLTASGALTEAQICERPDLTDQQRDDLLTMLQLRLYAEDYCSENGIALDGLPEIEQPAPIQGPKTKEEIEMEALTLQALMMGGAASDGKFNNEEFGPLTRGLSQTEPTPYPRSDE